MLHGMLHGMLPGASLQIQLLVQICTHHLRSTSETKQSKGLRKDSQGLRKTQFERTQISQLVPALFQKHFGSELGLTLQHDVPRRLHLLTDLVPLHGQLLQGRVKGRADAVVPVATLLIW